MDILDILLDILLKPPRPLMGLFFPITFLKSLHAARIDELADCNEPAKILSTRKLSLTCLTLLM